MKIEAFHGTTGAASAQAARLPKPPVKRDPDLYRACQDFEAIFVKQMLDVMRKTVQKNEFLGGGLAEEVFEDMLYDEYAKEMAQTARLGMADMLYRQLNKGL